MAAINVPVPAAHAPSLDRQLVPIANAADQVALDNAASLTPLGATAIDQLQQAFNVVLAQHIQPLNVNLAKVNGKLDRLANMNRNAALAKHGLTGFAPVMNQQLHPIPQICINSPLTSADAISLLNHVTMIAWVNYYGITANPNLNALQQREAYIQALLIEIGV